MEWADILTSRRCMLHRHGVDASDCAENIYIQDGGYDYDLGGVVLTTTWWRCSCPSSVGMR